MSLELKPRQSGGGLVKEISAGLWRMEIPAGSAGAYRLAELDDHLHSARSRFPWQEPIQLELQARVSAADLPGTWGFGFWNNPFSANLGLSGMARSLPVLPNAAWFFYAGPPNYLAVRDTHPAAGFLAAIFSAPKIPSLALAPAGLVLPLLAVPPAARLLRRAARLLIGEDSTLVDVDPTQWHAYRLDWRKNQVRFFVDGREFFSTPVTPRGRLGLVIWIDNQYAAFPPSGKLCAGTSSNPDPAWLEVDQVQVFYEG
ncbi:MAG: hypothetical protein IH586_21190 [Anaerolineaceae bacterium]|nr:hypothetical protein [Anaerolineaceae bacterium]